MTEQRINPNQPMPSWLGWRFHNRPTNIQRAYEYEHIILAVHELRCRAADARQAERDRLRVISEAEVERALLPVTETPAPATVAEQPKPTPGWFQRMFGAK